MRQIATDFAPMLSIIAGFIPLWLLVALLK